MDKWDNFFDIVLQREPDTTISYRSANFVFEEGLRNGRWVALSYNASGYMMAANPLPKPFYMEIERLACPQSFEAVLDGQSLCSHFVFEDCKIQRCDNEISSCVILRHMKRPVKVHICTKLDGTPVMQRHIEIENLKDGPAALSEIAPLSGGVQMMNSMFGKEPFRTTGHERLYRLGYFHGSNWGMEGNFQWEELPDAIYTIGGRFRWDKHRHPIFVLNNRLTGEYFIAQLGWSGGYSFSFDYQNEEGNNAFMCIRIALDAPAPVCVIEAGECWASPEVHIGAVFGGLDNAVNSMNRHLRRVIWPKKAGRRELIETGIGPEYDMSNESTLKAVDYAASVGSEVFFIDAGWYLEPKCENDWYKKAGDWTFNKNRYPEGISVVRDRCHEKGILFGVWMEAERFGSESDMIRIHPEWVQTSYNGCPNPPGFIDMGIPECAQWVEEQIAGLISDNQLDFFRLDWNPSVNDTINAREHGDWLENTFVRHYNALYRIFESLRIRFPEVIFENCASGGARTDIGLAKYFTHTWVTDWQIHPNAFRITNGMTLALPPEHIDRLIGGQLAYTTADMQTQLRNQLFTHMTVGGITPNGAACNDKQMEMIRRNISIYKEFVRPFLPDSNIYHHTPVISGHCPTGFGILELDSQDGMKGILSVFQLSSPTEEETVVRLRGIDASKTYRVTFDNTASVCMMRGLELTNNGLHIRLEGALTSELVLYEAVDRDDNLNIF